MGLVYLPTLTIQNQPFMLGNYTFRPMDGSWVANVPRILDLGLFFSNLKPVFVAPDVVLNIKTG